jgi:hypothetical protein
VVHTAFCETEGELCGGIKVGGGGVEKRNQRALNRRFRPIFPPKHIFNFFQTWTANVQPSLSGWCCN